MKKIGILLISLIIFWSGVASADLTKQDMEDIRKIVREEVQREVRRIDERIDSLDKRIDDLRNLLYVILAGMFALVGFVIWDRRTALAPAVKKVEALEEREKAVERILKEFALKEPKLAAVMRNVAL